MNSEVDRCPVGDRSQDIRAWETLSSVRCKLRFVTWGEGAMTTRLLRTLAVLFAVVTLSAVHWIQAKRDRGEVPNFGGPIKAGAHVPGLVLRTLDGKEHRIAHDSSERPTVIYAMAPLCVWCVRNSNCVDALAQGINDRFRMVIVATHVEGLDGYLATHKPVPPLLVGLTEDAKFAYRLGHTPSTLVVSQAGVVDRVWIGAYTGRNKTEIEGYFGVTLPEQTSEPVQMEKARPMRKEVTRDAR